MSEFLLAASIPVLGAVYGITIYNRLVRKRTLAEEAWSGIDVQLKRRADLIPNLVQTVKGYATHEAETLAEVTRYRGQAQQATGQSERQQAEKGLSQALFNLMAVSENYPELKADQNFLDLQQALMDLEDQIQLANRYYNGTVRDLNILIEQFPSNLVARWAKFVKRSFFELENPQDRIAPVVNFAKS